MIETVFAAGSVIAMLLVVRWGARVLPKEHWQVLASVPVSKTGNGEWTAVTFTWYGFFTATAYVTAILYAFILLSSLSVPVPGILVTFLILLCISVPASRLMAGIVEKKANTFSIGGAFFITTLAVPWLLILWNLTAGTWTTWRIPVLPALAAVGIAYALGEGLGRLACISFGCCYGKPITEIPDCMVWLLQRHAQVFTGKTKKIAYASDLDGTRVVPIQTLTAAVLIITAGIGMLLFFSGTYRLSFAFVVTASQLWRFFSETLRADHRGGRSISAYQIMSIFTIFYASILSLLLPASAPGSVDLHKSLSTLWHPAVIITMQIIWLSLFIYWGKSRVLGSFITCYVRPDQV
ncbi:prolipoprotein diacylglyceryl transferase [bacterium]|nr:prolipoprotein diacylglyceryl transferase [candidate division CSSED10-310 bacterium]